MNLYSVTFNDYGHAYVLAKDWNEAGDKLLSKIKEAKIKEIKYLDTDQGEHARLLQ